MTERQKAYPSAREANRAPPVRPEKVEKAEKKVVVVAAIEPKAPKIPSYVPKWYQVDKNENKAMHRYQINVPKPKWEEFNAAIAWNAMEINKAKWASGEYGNDFKSDAAKTLSVIMDEFITKVRKQWKVEDNFPNLK